MFSNLKSNTGQQIIVCAEFAKAFIGQAGFVN